MNLRLRIVCLSAAVSVCWTLGALGDQPPIIPDAPADKPIPRLIRKKPLDRKAAETSTAKPGTAISHGPLTSGPAVARQNNINVRGQPSINSEVVSRLKQGDRVEVVEEITLSHPKMDEPAKWAKITLPENVAVWVHSSFIDMDSRTVKAKRLNLRTGPGENFSIAGRIDKGTPIKEIESKGEWMKIEAPSSAYAYVASHLLAPVAGDGAPAVVSTAPTPAPAPVFTPPPRPAPTITPIAERPPPVIAGNPPPFVQRQPPPAPAPVFTTPTPTATPPTPPVIASTTPSTTSPLVLTPVTTFPASSTEQERVHTYETTSPETTGPRLIPLPTEDQLTRRTVIREGIVRRAASIQSPTYFALEGLDSRRTINYIHSTNIVLGTYQGQRILVTGEEWLDERWPHTPVIEVETLQNFE